MTAHLRRSLTTLTLVAVMFFNVSGGAFTTESLIVSIGPAMGLLVEAIRARQCKVIVCVDMLGEGFDLPQLKIAALHA